MAATDPEIKDKFPIPLWMKARPSKDIDNFASSPPAPEDSFFFIKYPKSDLAFGKQNEPVLPQLKDANPSLAQAQIPNNTLDKDWSRHTKSCQKVLHGFPAINTAANTSAKPKSAGTDDGFTGEGAACGNSVLKVANKMVNQRGFAIASPSDEPMDERPSPSYLAARRGSKSLPTTPMHSPPGSPNSRRRRNVNRYFTSPFEQADNSGSRSWLTAALLGFKKDLTTSTSTLAEEDAIETRLQGVTLAESVENLGPAPKARDLKSFAEQKEAQPPKPIKSSVTYKPKPSEFREMNFWSPTSM